MKPGYIYILTNRKRGVLYIGVTNDILCRITEHKRGKGSVFTNKYNPDKLVYYECYEKISEAIFREKQLKRRLRKTKIKLIEDINPEWQDLYTNLLD